VPLAQSIGDLASLSRALDTIANVHWSHGEFDKHRSLLAEALDAAEHMSDPAACGGLMFMLGANALMVCEWQRAGDFFDRVDSVTQRLEHSRTSMFGLFGKGALCVVRGDWEKAETYLLECIDLAEKTGNLQMLSVARHHWAEQALLRGHAREVIASIRPLLTRSGIGDRELSLLYANLARAHLLTGDLTEADEASVIAIRHAALANDYLARVEAQRVQGMVRTAQHRWDEAEKAFAEVHAIVQDVMPYDDGRILLEWSIMSLRAGKLDQARAHSSEAHVIFQHLGAQEHCQRATRVLAEIDELLTAG
jgi:tetratricopeptide (TPR) repeat protein